MGAQRTRAQNAAYLKHSRVEPLRQLWLTPARGRMAQILWQTSALTAQGPATQTEPPQVSDLPLAQIRWHRTSQSGLLPACLSHLRVSAIEVEPSRVFPVRTTVCAAARAHGATAQLASAFRQILLRRADLALRRQVWDEFVAEAGVEVDCSGEVGLRFVGPPIAW
jgi:hypothetical protein